ncbi:alpha/beta hydrolase [Streptomyces piniterrae]|uniref:Alpha/beta hydrolase n=1 Tax=Streptomyces piniterrae TaxID=2571125 RepID=A0A4U0MYF2_9ACTN|nr:alpha/beta hydrolase [Streptomyces piniterrae]TJZ46251.1 alpha/beta hydrolase [Streptomyces piniterrae]
MVQKKTGGDEGTGYPAAGAVVGRRAVTRSAVLGASTLGASLVLAGCGGAGGGDTGAATGRQGKAGAPKTPGPKAGTGEGGGRTVRLPAPTGPHQVGVTTLHLVDRTRRDPWDPKIPVREVMVDVFYPARTVRGHPVARQMTEGAAGMFKMIDVSVHRLPKKGVNWAATTTHSHAGAPAAAPARSARRPVLLYTPGGGDPRTMGTGVAEELASHGYVVVIIDHPGDAGEVEFPNTTAERPERIRPTVFRADPRRDPKIFRTVIHTRIADIRFVLDQLEVLAAGRNPDAEGRALPEHLDRVLDLRRVGVYGHSAGGTAAAEALYEDRRIAAAVNLEGYLDYPPDKPGREGKLFPVARHGVDRPLLLVGTDGFPERRALGRSWSAMLAHPGGRTRRTQLDSAAHWVFTDYAAMAPQLQAAGLMTADDRNRLVGAIDPAESVPRVRHDLRSFFDRQLPAG